MPTFALFDRNAGFHQWTGTGATPRDVLVDFNNRVGVNPDGLPMDDVAAEFVAYDVSIADEAALSAWDGKADTFPLPNRTRLDV